MLGVPTQVIVDAKDVPYEALYGCIRTLLLSDVCVTVVNASIGTHKHLGPEFGDRLKWGDPTVDSRDLLITPGDVVFATVSLDRLRAEITTPGRVVVRVYVPGIAGEQRLSLWRGSWLAAQSVEAPQLLDLNLDF